MANTKEFITEETRDKIVSLIQDACEEATQGTDYGDPYEKVVREVTNVLNQLAGLPPEEEPDDFQDEEEPCDGDG